MKKVVVIGGGTGTFIVLSGLKKYPVDLSVIVSMMDSGGSTGRLRDQLGVLPPGDLRQCLVALSEASDLWRKLFLYRFEVGDLKGHNFGNIFLSALEKIAKNYQEVVNFASLILKTKGEVIPVTFDKTHLCVEYEDGEIIETEGRIDTTTKDKPRIKRAFLKPLARANLLAIKKIMEADYLILGPGDLYTSLIPNLIVKGIPEAVKKTQAKIIYIVNLMTKKGQTTNYSASQHVFDIEKYLMRRVDLIIINNGLIPKTIVHYYQDSGESVVKDDLKNDPRVIRQDLVDRLVYNKNKADILTRSILRHNSKKISRLIWQLMEK